MNELIAKSVVASEQHNPYGARGQIAVQYGGGIIFEFEIKLWNEKERYIRITREGKPFFFELITNLHPTVTNIDSLSDGQEFLTEILIATIIKNMEVSMEDGGNCNSCENPEGAIASVNVDILPADEELRSTLLAALGAPKSNFVM